MKKDRERERTEKHRKGHTKLLSCMINTHTCTRTLLQNTLALLLLSLSLSLFLQIHVIIHTLLNSHFKVFLFLVCYSQKKCEGLDSGPFLLSFYRFLPSSPSSLNARSVRLFERLSKDLIFSFLFAPKPNRLCVVSCLSSFLS